MPPQSKFFHFGIESPGGCGQDDNGVEIGGGSVKDGDMDPRNQPALEFRSGKPSLEEWDGLWKADGDDKTFSQDEFYAAYDSLRIWISQIGKVGYKEGCDFFIIGDIHGDKTHDIEIVNPSTLTTKFIDHIQQWIAQDYPHWRVIIPTYLDPKAVIIIYQNAVRLPKAYEVNLEDGLQRIREKMKGA